MYYPYLRAKQYELKALREFSAEHKGQDSITPILEPVKQQPNALDFAIDEMLANGLKFALILNPKDGDFKHPTVHFDAWSQNEKLMDNDHKKSWIPAFLYSKRNAHEIPSIIDKYKFERAMIIFRTCMDMDDENAWEIINNPSIGYIVNSFGSTISRRLRSKLKETGKQIIRLDDCFKSRVRNADYALEVDELFSEEPFFYKEEGHLDGYSDYTTLPSEYIEGGMLPYALAIHLSYRKNEEQLYVHHFVSDSNETNSDIRGKFREAAKKVAPFYEDKNQTEAVKEIIQKADASDGYPGLGYLKKLSVKNHLELDVAKILLSDIIATSHLDYSIDTCVDYTSEIQDRVAVWDRLKNSVKENFRFFTNMDEFARYDYLTAGKSLHIGQKLYRSRVTPIGQKKIKCDKMGCPPKELTTAGRANPIGIPYLYLSDSAKTTYFEVRAVYLDKLSVGTFRIERDLKLIDFVYDVNLFLSYNDGLVPLKETIIKKKVIEAISSDLSKPLRRYDSEIEYVPTQLICEYCRRIVDSEGATADGITFESSLHKGGRNYVLFDESAAKCIRVDSHEITRIDIDRK